MGNYLALYRRSGEAFDESGLLPVYVFEAEEDGIAGKLAQAFAAQKKKELGEDFNLINVYMLPDSIPPIPRDTSAEVTGDLDARVEGARFVHFAVALRTNRI